ncbi:sensor histidine kinase [Paenibacillaceae bacterium]|nr:sensor histidine kinase [Paenibacillaceae bacterium]
MKLFQRTFIYFITVVLLSLLLSTFIIYRQSTKALMRESDIQLEQTINNAVHHTNLFLEAYERSFVSLLVSYDLKKYVDLSLQDEYEYYETSSFIRDYVFKPILVRNPEVVSIYLLGEHGKAVYASLQGVQSAIDERELHQYLPELNRLISQESLLTISSQSVIHPNNKGLFTISANIKGVNSTADNKGVLLLELRSNEMSKLWEGIDIGERGYFFIMDSFGKIVYHQKPELVGTEVEPDLKPTILDKMQPGSFTQEVDGVPYVMIQRETVNGGWHLVVAKPLQEVNRPLSSIQKTTAAVSLLSLAIALWLSHLFSKSIVRPIHFLRNSMKLTDYRKWKAIPLTNRHDEIDELTHSYNKMTSHISALIEQVYEGELKHKEVQLERQRAEFQALQLQINPHFLYNTLETIVCYAIVQESEEISDIVKAMAYMMRYSVQTNLEEVTMVNELKHVLNYMVILEHRIGRPFEINVTVPPELLLMRMVRLTLQPLVENIFQHAFPNGVSEHHAITIGGVKTEDAFIVVVEDNGHGIAPDVLESLREKLRNERLQESASHTGIGLLNVHRRIQLVFGDEYGLRIDSEEGFGTKVTMVMPCPER